MFLIFRWWYFVGIAGIGLTGFGAVEANLSLQSGSEPVEISIAELAKGSAPAQPYVKIGPHVALFEHAAYSRRKGRIDHAYYPIVSREHPYVQAWDRLRTKYANAKDIPQGEVPQLDGIKVLVQSKSLRAPATGSGVREQTAIVGTLFSFEGLSSAEQNMVTGTLQRADATQVLVLEEGRCPRPFAVCVLMIVSGVIALWGAIKLYRRPAPA